MTLSGMNMDNSTLCATLTPSEVCLVVEQYREGRFSREFHEHVPKSRLSKEGRLHLLRALVVHFSQMGPETIVRCYLNKRGRNPEAVNGFPFHVTYPERGVLRTYCGANTNAWSDEVIAPADFRKMSKAV
jgi:hypothetical protein